jgi:Transglutaminase-like superfamily
MKKIIYFLCLSLVITKITAQDKALTPKFDNVSLSELNLKYYEKDSSANAVVLYEKAFTKMAYHHDDIVVETTFYYKVKIFNTNGYENATITIPIYNNSKSKERIFNIKGITHNLENNHEIKTLLDEKHIFKTKVSDNLTEIKFTLPNLKKGSVIEYMYTRQSPYFFKFTGWQFQGEIPKIYSELHSLIPGNWVYHKNLIGYRSLDVNKQKIKRDCFYVRSIKSTAECEDLTYAMRDIPAFKEEDFSTSRKNHLSRIAFELSEIHYFNGDHEKFTKTWKDVDKQLRYEYAIGSQLNKVGFTKKLLPDALFTESDSLKKAIKIYHYIQNYFKWNEEYHIFKNVNFKRAFKTKIGNATEINIALCNALNAAGIPTHLVLLSTRNNGLPTFVHPVLSDFNYAIALAKIGKNNYQLDASNKLLPFSLLPYKALNSYGRVLTFKKGSFWENLNPNRNIVTTSVYLGLKQNHLSGFMRISSTAYTALDKRSEIKTFGEKKYLKDFENNSKINDLIIKSYRNKNLNNLEKVFIEDFNVSQGDSLSGEDMIIINPFINGLSKNPFNLKERTYPVDFGYPRTINYSFKFNVPNGYSIISIPKNVTTNLAKNAVLLVSKSTISNQNIIINYKFSINKITFPTKEYQSLKNLYKKLIELNKEVIILKKK